MDKHTGTASKQARETPRYRVVWFCPVTGRLVSCDFASKPAAVRNANNLANRGAIWGAL